MYVPYIQGAQTLFIVVAGLWALYLYRTSRKSQATVRIQHTFRLATRDDSAFPVVLIVQIRIANLSPALFRNREATCTVMDASTLDGSGRVRLLPFARQDPMIPAYGEQTSDLTARSRMSR